ncbi:MAG: ribonuclease PH, partial [candidate division Zixibacteria bacterium]|nr:ribonuclease PH [candidate division Zixibacteria bacterium]
MTFRIDRREHDQIRPVEFLPGFIEYPEGSVLITAGKTKVLCNATINEDLPRWMKETGNGGGWVTAEYALLPRSTHSRTSRETSGFGGRTQEI